MKNKIKYVFLLIFVICFFLIPFTYATDTTSSENYTINLSIDNNTKPNQTIKTTKNYTFPKNSFSKKGYTFVGWKVTNDLNNSRYYWENEIIDLSKIVSDTNVNITAQWVKNNENYTIKFDGNGSTDGSTSSINAKYEITYKLTKNGFKKKGYIFNGWNTKSDGSGTSYSNKATIKNLTSKKGASITLYAQWKKNEYSITYNLNNGKNNPANPSSYFITTPTITLATPSRTGYKFIGWYSDSEYKKQITKIAKGSTGNKILYAKWLSNNYTIKFNGNGSTDGSTSSISAKYGTTYKLTKNGFKKKGYIFKGWNTKADGSGNFYSNQASIKNLTYKNEATITLYAQWKKTEYSITYNLNNGKNDSANPNSYFITTPTITLAPPSRKGYTFGGWYSDSEFTKKITQIVKGSTGNKTLYAKWIANKYTIQFDGNGANSGSTSNISAKYGKTYELTKNGFKRTGFAFSNWNTKPDGSGTSYSNKASVKNLSSTNSSTITLYAQWTAIKYTIKFDGNGSTNGSTPEISAIYGKSYTLSPNGFTKEKSSFLEWNTKPDGSGKSYSNKATIKNLTETNGTTIILYAQWEIEYEIISLDATLHTQKEIKDFCKNHPISKQDTFKKKPSTQAPYEAGVLSTETINSCLNAINSIRYVAGVDYNRKENSEYSVNASCATLVNCLNGTLTHYPELPNNMKNTDSIYINGRYGASHSNIAYGYYSFYDAILGFMEDSDSSNIDRLGHRRWIIYPYLNSLGFGKTENFYALQVFDDADFMFGNNVSGQSIAWPAQNTPTNFFLDGSAWSLSLGTYNLDASQIKVTVTRKSDKKKWKFSSTSSDGYFTVNNDNYGDPGCIIFKPNNIDTSAGQSYTVEVCFDNLLKKIKYNVNFFSL